MKSSMDVVLARRKDMLEMVRQKGTVSVTEIKNSWEWISLSTIRRDLDWLHRNGLVLRSYGNVVYNTEKKAAEDQTNMEVYRRALAKYAASLIGDRETVYINTSNASLYMLEYIRGKDVTVVTNNVKAMNLDVNPGVQIILTGGELRKPVCSMTGDYSLNLIREIKADKCFIGCGGVSVDGEITTGVYSEASVNKTMIDCCEGPVYIIADHGKVGKRASYSVRPVSCADYLITDQEAKMKDLEKISKKGIEVIRVNTNNNAVSHIYTQKAES